MAKIDNEQELRFVRHLFTKIKGELTGSEVSEVLNDGPRDRFHAGVLLPQELELPAANGSAGGLLGMSLDDDAPASEAQALAPKVDSESIMSIDFQVRLPEGVDHLILKIKPSFSVYYAVF